MTGLLVLTLLSSMACAKETPGVTQNISTQPEFESKATPSANIYTPILTVEPAPKPLPAAVLVPHATVADFPLVVNTVIEKHYYLPGQPVKITVYITNIGPENITFRQFPPEITVESDEDGSRFDIAGAGNESFELQHEFRAVYELTWNQKNTSGTQVRTGWYLVTVANVYFTRESGRSTLANWGDQRIDIQPSYPQGVWIKNMEPGISQCVNGNNVTLNQVSLTQNGSTFTFFCTPANYFYGGRVSNAQAIGLLTINGTTRSAGFAGYGDDTPHWIRLVWGGNNPLEIVPKDLDEITFTITSIIISTYDQQSFNLVGPWVFKIPLQKVSP